MASLTSVFLREECNLIHVLKSYKKNYLSYWCYSVLYSYISAQTIRKDEEGTHTSMLNTFMLWVFLSLAHWIREGDQNCCLVFGKAVGWCD